MLTQEIAGVTFPNPVGLAAGFDKDCHFMKILPDLGFGFEEVGSITAEPYEGNPGPRLKRLVKDESIIVYYGLKNQGAKALKQKLNKQFRIPIGVSIAKTNKLHKTMKLKIADWIKGIKLMKSSGDYLTINLSCPNTFDPTNFCNAKDLKPLLAEVAKLKIKKPVFLKITADLTRSEADRILDVCKKHDFITGFILTNLVKDRSKVKFKSEEKHHKNYKGGLSGKIVQKKAVALTKYFYEKTQGKYVLIGCGGIFTAEDAYEYIKNGASLVQLITGMIFEGPAAIKNINKGLVELLEKDGYRNISEAVGSARTLK